MFCISLSKFGLQWGTMRICLHIILNTFRTEVCLISRNCFFIIQAIKMGIIMPTVCWGLWILEQKSKSTLFNRSSTSHHLHLDLTKSFSANNSVSMYCIKVLRRQAELWKLGVSLDEMESLVALISQWHGHDLIYNSWQNSIRLRSGMLGCAVYVNFFQLRWFRLIHGKLWGKALHQSTN